MNKNKIYKILFFATSFSTYLFGYGENNVSSTYQQTYMDNYEAQQKINEDQQRKYEAQKNYLDLTGKGWKIRSTLNDDRNIQEELNQLTLLKSKSKPLIKPMVDMDSLNIHSMFPLVLLLPNGVNITNAYCFPATARPNFQFNRIDVLPSAELLTTTLMITYIQNNEIKTMNILLTKIKNVKNNLLYREIRYVEDNYLTPEEVLTRYYDAHGKYPKANSMIQIGRNNYQFIKDNINGSITIDGVNGRFLMRINGN